MEIKNKVEYIDIKKLTLLENNPRQISKDNFEKLKKSIKDNPDYFEARPIICSDRTEKLVILAGNQRYKASKDLGLKQVPCIILHNLTEQKEKEIVIRDNVELGDWDYDLLANDWEIEDLKEWGVDVPVFDSVLNELENDAFKNSLNNELESFEITFIFPIDLKEKIEKIIKKKTKNALTEEIKELILSYDF